MKNPDLVDHRIHDPYSLKEVMRAMPRGARGWLIYHTEGTPLGDFPGPILKWLTDRRLIKVSESLKSRGQLVLTPVGHRAIDQLKKQGTGYRD